MLRWNTVITNAGLSMLADVTAEKPIEIVRMACASGFVSVSELRAQNALTDEEAEMQITYSRKLSGNVYKVEGVLENTSIDEKFNIRQIGLFAKMGETEALFEIAQVIEGDPGDRVPTAEEEPGFSAVYTLEIAVASETNISVVVDSGTLAEMKRYVDAEVVAVGRRVDDLADRAALIFSDSFNITLDAADWEETDKGYYRQVKYPELIGTGASIDTVRGTVGVGTITADFDKKMQVITRAKITAEKNGADGIIFKAHGECPNIDIPVAFNLEYDGSSVANALFSVFPAYELPVVSDVYTVQIPEQASFASAEVSGVVFDTANYSYTAEVVEVTATEEGETEAYALPVIAALNPAAGKIGFKLFTEGEHNDVINVKYRIVGTAI